MTPSLGFCDHAISYLWVLSHFQTKMLEAETLNFLHILKKYKFPWPLLSSFVLGEVIGRTWLPVDWRAGPGQLEAPHPTPVLGMHTLPTVFTLGAVLRVVTLREYGAV